MTLDSLMGMLMGGGKPSASEEPADANPLTALLGRGGLNVGDLLEGLLGGAGGRAEAATGAAEQAGLSPAILQAALALVLGRLRGSGASGTGGGLDLSALLGGTDQAAEVDEAALAATGLPQELAAKTGIDLGDALKALQSVLALLTGRKLAPTTRKRSSTRKRTTTRRSTARSSTTRKKASSAKAKTPAKSRTTKSGTAAKRSGSARAAEAKDTVKPRRAPARAKAKSTASTRKKSTTGTARRTRSTKKTTGVTLTLPPELVDALKGSADK